MNASVNPRRAGQLRDSTVGDRANGSASAPFDVLILGAGNVGLLTALLLHRQGLSVRVCDRRPPGLWTPEPGFDARVYAISSGNRAHLEALGVWQHLPAGRLGQIDAMQVHGDQQGQLGFAGSGAPLATVVEDRALQGALLQTLNARLDGDWLQQDQFDSITVEPGHATLRRADHGAVHARLVVGADGAQSWLRGALGWTAQVSDYGQQGVVVNLACAEAHQHCARQWFSEGEVIALLPLGGLRVSLVWSAHQANADALLAGGAEAIVTALEARIGAPLGALRPISQPAAFPLRLTRVPQICDHRLVLLGDAAHGVHPLAGQGLNLGLEDALSLAEVLRTRGSGPDVGDRSVLRRHARQRAEPVARMQWVTDGLQRLFAPDHPALRGLRNQGLHLVDRTPLFKSLLAAAAAGASPQAQP